jgi:hypothetical protein
MRNNNTKIFDKQTLHLIIYLTWELFDHSCIYELV